MVFDLINDPVEFDLLAGVLLSLPCARGQLDFELFAGKQAQQGDGRVRWQPEGRGLPRVTVGPLRRGQDLLLGQALGQRLAARQLREALA